MQMDIYMRRRLVALAIVVGVFILIVLAIRSCGDGEDSAPLQPQSGAGETTNEGLAREEYIAEADAVCAEAKASIENIDPEDEDALVQERELTEQVLGRLQSLVPAELPKPLERYQGSLQRLIEGLETKQMARDRGDVEAEAEADAAIDDARQRADRAARAYGFSECDGFGDASGAQDGSDEDSETGATAPTTTAPAPAPTTTPTAPPADGGAVAPPDAGGGTGGGTGGGGGSGGVAPPDSGGLSP